jgi:HSP20 family molecular chaperone IbpA
LEVWKPRDAAAKRHRAARFPNFQTNNVPERSYGSFSRSFWLPSDADEEHVDASFEDGVLTKRLPKTQARKPRASAVK